ncbi:DEAD/DEAH box helicase [Halobacteriovorax sp. HLS]|uniref:DEAD/DEAH box helicase n=1 Tax=Halobacteriovorax sp. HLS TaxID=2234000 RepID=UPI000FD9DA1F|nr:DEAD/DEAH box helicase [Halobacteriovorax sp. HLS]
MIPTLLSSQVERGVKEFLESSFQITNEAFHPLVRNFVAQDENVFKGPYVSLKLPFKKGINKELYFQNILSTPFYPYLHQEKAFNRLVGDKPKSTVVATGTGSGKTKCFMLPVLDYCFRNRDKQGIKAILVYPMNALATDQAKELAKLISSNESLKNRVTAGVFVGGKNETPNKFMKDDELITDKETLRKSPPDILITNYKMLDMLMLRSKDYPIWRHNESDTLRYLVVDELHTFDGAQGSDLACLIRRLKSRLNISRGDLCCVGTSATLGSGEESKNELIRFSKEIFGEDFDSDSIIGESVQSRIEFFNEVDLNNDLKIPAINEHDLLVAEDEIGFAKLHYRKWFKDELDTENKDWPLLLSKSIKSHPLLNDILAALNGKTLGYKELIRLLEESFSYTKLESPQNILSSFLGLVSLAKVDIGECRAPFLHTRVQSWMRELRRMVASVDTKPQLKFSDDLTGNDLKRHLPVVCCNDCGYTGWGATKEKNSSVLEPGLSNFYQKYFANSTQAIFIFPWEERFSNNEELLPCYLHKESLSLYDGIPEDVENYVRVYPYQKLGKRKGGANFLRKDCPVCNSKESLIILGARAATLTSSLISQVFSSSYNTDKKLLTFSDSVQDASHRASYFEAKTYRQSLLMAIQQYVDNHGADLCLDELDANFSQKWIEKNGIDNYIATFLPADLFWLKEYSNFKKLVHKKDDIDTLLRIVKKRVSFEINCEYGLKARIGDSLEKAGASVAYIDRSKLDDFVSKYLIKYNNELGGFRDISKDKFYAFLLIFLKKMLVSGAVEHEDWFPYIENKGNPYLLGRKEHTKSFGPSSKLPSFLTNTKIDKFNLVLPTSKNGRTWCTERFFQHLSTTTSAVDFYNLFINDLVAEEILFQVEINQIKVWGIKSSVVKVTAEVSSHKCEECGHKISLPSLDDSIELTCLQLDCSGTYGKFNEQTSFYKKLYKNGQVQRVFAAEHTGLLERDARESLEKRFMNRKSLTDENLLSCTPTLEMGINIGDLSNVVLCSIPPRQANFIQRVGRAGRTTGSAYVATIANAKPHDLFFYDEPELMSNGAVRSPGIFLDAPEVLKRQYIAFVVDSWVNDNNGETGIPLKLNSVLSSFEARSENKFPYNFIAYHKEHRDQLLEKFFNVFDREVRDSSKQYIKEFVVGGDESSDSIGSLIIDGVEGIKKELDGYLKKVRSITQKIKSIKEAKDKDKNYLDQIKDLESEKKIYNELANTIKKKLMLNHLTDEGLLPNYAFPEQGVVLKSIIFRVVSKGDGERSLETDVFEYERAAATGIYELAPHSKFYANSRVVTVNQVNMSTATKEEWLFCDTCDHMEIYNPSDPVSSCPVCGSTGIRDKAQVKTLIKMRQMIATASDKDARALDKSEDRSSAFYSTNLFVDIDSKDVQKSYKVSDEKIPFGYEFVSKVALREVNFGSQGSGDELIKIGNKDYPVKGFILCSSCGRVADDSGEINHTKSCTARNKEKSAVEGVYLYRDFVSEGIKILLPVASFDITKSEQQTSVVQSFSAGLFLGLREKFKGDPGHLKITLFDEPDKLNPNTRRWYLLLYDGIPGGTGYLKDLMKSPQELMDVLELSLERLKSCSCNKEESKDGCYRCLYAYRERFNKLNTSRNLAIEILSQILTHRTGIEEIETIDTISLNTLIESELERSFVEVMADSIRRNNGSFEKGIVNGKNGWIAKINDFSYEVEPQVEIGWNEGIDSHMRADFVMWPKPLNKENQRKVGAQKLQPIVIFVDGFDFHPGGPGKHSRVGKDFEQRMALIDTDSSISLSKDSSYIVWSLSYDDVTDFKNGITQAVGLSNTNDYNKILKVYASKIPSLKKFQPYHNENSFSILMEFLANPNLNLWRAFCHITALSFFPNDIFTNEKEVEDFKDTLKRNEIGEDDISPSPVDDGSYKVSYNDFHGELDQPILRIFLNANKSEITSLGKIETIVRLYDDLEFKNEPSFKKYWEAFLKLHNIFQFGRNLQFFSSTSELRKATSIQIAEPFVDDSINDFLDLVKITLRPVVQDVYTRIGKLPECPLELLGQSGEVIGQGEIGWKESKIVVLTDEDMVDLEKFKDAEWTVFTEFEANSEQIIKKLSEK